MRTNKFKVDGKLVGGDVGASFGVSPETPATDALSTAQGTRKTRRRAASPQVFEVPGEASNEVNYSMVNQARNRTPVE